MALSRFRLTMRTLLLISVLALVIGAATASSASAGTYVYGSPDAGGCTTGIYTGQWAKDLDDGEVKPLCYIVR
jgi:hypothetical protein